MGPNKAEKQVRRSGAWTRTLQAGIGQIKAGLTEGTFEQSSEGGMEQTTGMTGTRMLQGEGTSGTNVWGWEPACCGW